MESHLDGYTVKYHLFFPIPSPPPRLTDYSMRVLLNQIALSRARTATKEFD